MKKTKEGKGAVMEEGSGASVSGGETRMCKSPSMHHLGVKKEPATWLPGEHNIPDRDVSKSKGPEAKT